MAGLGNGFHVEELTSIVLHTCERRIEEQKNNNDKVIQIYKVYLVVIIRLTTKLQLNSLLAVDSFISF